MLSPPTVTSLCWVRGTWLFLSFPSSWSCPGNFQGNVLLSLSWSRVLAMFFPLSTLLGESVVPPSPLRDQNPPATVFEETAIHPKLLAFSELPPVGSYPVAASVGPWHLWLDRRVSAVLSCPCPGPFPPPSLHPHTAARVKAQLPLRKLCY